MPFALSFLLVFAYADEPVNEPAKLWSFQPLNDPSIPRGRQIDWSLSPLDQFILANLEKAQLAPAPPATKRALIRRATFDLIGLPPTLAEIEEFLADQSPDAFSRVLERLLTSPHYGERWGRHWLDVARYADSNGMDENLAYANAYRYRDYVIASFNQDKPYDEFVREQIAGDLISAAGEQAPKDSLQTNPKFERLIATGFLLLGPKMLAEDDPVKMEMDIIDEQVDTIGRTFLGLTLGCARCHDHKYDPITMDDYYGLAGIFKSSKTMEHYKVVARWHERPLGTSDQIAAQNRHKKEVADRKAEIERIVREANESILVEARRRASDYLLAATALQRHNARLKTLKSQLSNLEFQTGGGTPHATIIEAENFSRGNVRKEFTGYGETIGVIYNDGALPNFAEYDVEVTEAGAYQLELRYAAAESRPVRLSVNGKTVRSDAANRVTGSWFPDTQTWAPEVIVLLQAGKNSLRLERDQAFPHFDKIGLVRQAGLESVTETLPRSPEEIAAEYKLNPDFVKSWSRYLEETKRDSGSVLHAWHLVASLDAGSPDSLLFSDLKQSAERALARRYQELFDDVDNRWRALRNSPEGKDAKELPDASHESLRKLLYDAKGPFALPPKPETYYADAVASELRRQRDDLAEIEKSFTPLPEAMAMDEGQPQNLRLHLRGSHWTLGDEVPRRFPRVISNEGGVTPLEDKQSGRLQLAEWLTDPDSSGAVLAARVMVNRIWHWHFGAGLVRSTDNFGRLGDRPSNTALLDWLACRFIESGWSIKSMHRLIMQSSTYQMSTAYDERSAEIDPDNRLQWRMNRRRLEAEAIRDSLLVLAGQLDRTMGGSLFEGTNRAYVPGYPNGIYDKYDFPRRSVYLPVIRSMLYDVLQAFDFADPSAPAGERSSTTVAPQALFMLNSRFMAKQTRLMAARLLSDPVGDEADRIRDLYEISLGRPPTDHELERAREFLERYEHAVTEMDAAGESALRAWQALCRTILASNEFMFVE